MSEELDFANSFSAPTGGNDEMDFAKSFAPKERLSPLQSGMDMAKRTVETMASPFKTAFSKAKEIGESPAGPAIAGSLAAGAVTGGLGDVPLLGAAALQALGAAGGAGYGIAARRAAGQPIPPTAKDAAIEMGKQGALAGGTELGLGLAGKAASSIAENPTVQKLVAQLAKAGPSIPEESTKAVLKDPEILSRAVSSSDLGKAYDQFEAKNNLIGLRGWMRKNWQDLSPNELRDFALGIAKKVEDDHSLVPNQALYIASQVSRKLRDLAKVGNPDAIAALNGGLVGQAKDVIDAHLEKMIPGYANLRKLAFESNVADDFKSFLPLNKNQSPNALRSALALHAAAGAAGGALGGYAGGKEGAEGGALAGLAAPLLISPVVAGTAIKGAALASKGARAIAPLAPSGALAASSQGHQGPVGKPIVPQLPSAITILMPNGARVTPSTPEQAQFLIRAGGKQQ